MRKREIYLVVIFITVGVIVSFSQTIIYYLKTPPGTYFPLVHNYIEDYYYYLHLMRQGWEGKWLATSWFTPEVFPPQFVNIWFLFLGHAARFFHLSLEVTYTLSRGIGATVLFLLSYQLIKLIYPDSSGKRVIALGIVIFGIYWWGWSQGPTVPTLVHQWTALDPLFRGSYIPHHLWSKIFMISAFLIMMKFVKNSSLTGLIGVAITVLLMGFTSPVTLVTFVPVVSLWLVFERIAAKKTFFVWIFAILLSIGIAYYYRMLEQGVFPWNSYKAWEDSMRYPISIWSYFQSLGPQFILFLIAVPWLWKKMEGRLLIAWTVTSWFLLFILDSFLPISNSRFLDGYQFIPIGIGAVEGVWILGGKRKFIIIGSLLVYFTIGLFASWEEHIFYIEQNKTNPQVYVPYDYLSAFRYLDKNAPKESVVLAPYSIGTMIPAFTGNRVVWGHPLMTQESTKKRQDITIFYSLSSVAASKRILTQYRVSYIWVPNPLIFSREFQTELNVKEVFRNPQVTIFKVQSLR